MHARHLFAKFFEDRSSGVVSWGRGAGRVAGRVSPRSRFRPQRHGRKMLKIALLAAPLAAFTLPAMAADDCREIIRSYEFNGFPELTDAQFEERKAALISCLRRIPNFPTAGVRPYVENMEKTRARELQEKAQTEENNRRKEELKRTIEARDRQIAASNWIDLKRNELVSRLLTDDEIAKAKEIASDYPSLTPMINDLMERQKNTKERLSKEATESEQVKRALSERCNKSIEGIKYLETSNDDFQRAVLLAQAGEIEEACKLFSELETSINDARTGLIQCSKDV
jgi:hypothetical protein